ncbi:MAG: alpha/beta hydrolase [Pseudomonadota bacterium]
MLRKIIKTVLMLPVVALVVGVAASCTQLGLNYASLEVDNKPTATPPISAVSEEEWRADQMPNLRAAMEMHVFGPVPTGVATRTVSHRVIDPAYRAGRGSLEEYILEIGTGSDAVRFHLAAVFPNQVTGQVPLIIGQTFSQNPGVFRQWDLYPGPEMENPPENGEGSGGMAMGLVTFIFGEYIEKAPVDEYLERGYAFANFYAGEIVPDRGEAGRQALQTFPAGADGRRPTGAIAAWAAGYFAAINALDADPRIDPSRTAVLGHSRHGKSALIAGAWDERIELIISHQSGTGGASLNRQKPGESIRQITRSYPHWFDPVYATYADRVQEMPVDQHMLVSLIAPRRLLLGNGRRDVWSDPNGAFRAARGASPAWNTFGKAGLSQAGLRDFDPTDDIAFFLRPGGHGIVRADIDAFLAFLDASFTSDEGINTAVR